jgi:hypothetical protein
MAPEVGVYGLPNYRQDLCRFIYVETLLSLQPFAIGCVPLTSEGFVLKGKGGFAPVEYRFP